jgi:tRNA(Ile2) C34 agmatinyltransferase TiaS
MISDEKMINICIGMVIVGVVVLYVLTQMLVPVEITAVDLNEALIGHRVKLTGTVKSYFSHDGNVFMSVGDDYNEIKVVFFSQHARRNPLLRDIRNGMDVGIVGNVKIYKGVLEVVGDKLFLVT